MAKVKELHDAVKRGDLALVKALLDEDRALTNAVSTTDARGTYPLHVAAEFGQAEAARILLGFGANVSLLDAENYAIALGGQRSSAGQRLSRSFWKQDRNPANATSMV